MDAINGCHQWNQLIDTINAVINDERKSIRAT
jgi:hypothetical protein